MLTAKTTETEKKERKKEKAGRERGCVHICVNEYTIHDCFKCLYVYFPALVEGVIGSRPGRAILELGVLSLTVVPHYVCKRTVCLQ